MQNVRGQRSTSSLNVIAVVGWHAVVVPTIKSRRPCLRIGEAAGVRWSDIDDNVLSIVGRVYNRKVDDLKTKGPRRQLPLSNELEAGELLFRP